MRHLSAERDSFLPPQREESLQNQRSTMRECGFEETRYVELRIASSNYSIKACALQTDDSSEKFSVVAYFIRRTKAHRLGRRGPSYGWHTSAMGL